MGLSKSSRTDEATKNLTEAQRKSMLSTEDPGQGVRTLNVVRNGMSNQVWYFVKGIWWIEVVIEISD